MLERSRPGAPRRHRAESAFSTPRRNLDQDQHGADPRLGHQGELTDQSECANCFRDAGYASA